MKSLQDLAKELEGLKIEEVKIPEFGIPNWPEAADSVTVDLGKRSYLYPVKTDESGLLKLIEKHSGIQFTIDSGGELFFDFYGWSYFFIQPEMCESSSTGDSMDRIRVLLLFEQFKEEIFSQVIQKLQEDLQDHNQVIEHVKKAFEPFIPFLPKDE